MYKIIDDYSRFVKEDYEVGGGRSCATKKNKETEICIDRDMPIEFCSCFV